MTIKSKDVFKNISAYKEQERNVRVVLAIVGFDRRSPKPNNPPSGFAPLLPPKAGGLWFFGRLKEHSLVLLLKNIPLYPAPVRLYPILTMKGYTLAFKAAGNQAMMLRILR